MYSVVIPAYNEENGIQATIDEIHSVFLKEKITAYEIIVVDDGSTDNTADYVKNATVIRHPHNIGYGRSLKDGIIVAHYDTIIITDADLTYPFLKVPELLEAMEKGFDMVVGARTGSYYRESFFKSPLRKILKFLVEFTAGREIPDINSGLRIFKRKTVLPYLNHLCDTFSFTTSLTLAYMMTGKFVHYLPIPYEKREGKSKVKLFRDSLRTLQYILQAINYYNPIKIFLLLSTITVLLSLFSLVTAYIIQMKVFFFLGIGGIITSIVILALGLIADLLKQVWQK